MKPIAVIAIGGNSLTRPGEHTTLAEMRATARVSCEGIADILAMGYRVVLTHGNGPQVGEALLRAELTQPDMPRVRLDGCDAETQGLLGYLLQQTLGNVLDERGLRVPVITLVTQVVVDPEDPAFDHPTKPIGPFYRVEEAIERMNKLKWTMVEDSGRGWRRVVPSPRPLEIVEVSAVRACLHAGAVVIAAGGGGIPVVQRMSGRGHVLEGIEAVIDKDRASALLASRLKAETLLFSTGVDRVAVHFGRPDQSDLRRLPWQLAQRFLAEGEFPAGSMGPKIEAALEFLRDGGRRVVVTSPEHLAAAMHGMEGTEILPPESVSPEVKEPHPAVA